MAYREIESLTRVNHWEGRNGHPVEGMFVHVAEGYRASTVSWFHNPESEASTQKLVCKNGDRITFVRDEDTAWANGVLNKPNLADPFIRKWSEQNINPNRRTVSTETERYKNERLTPEQLDSLCELAVQWHTKFRWPTDGSRIFGHNEVDSVNRPQCPSLIPAEWAAINSAVAGLDYVVAKPAPPTNTTSETYDMVTGKYIHPAMFSYYKKMGGWPVLGHPKSEAALYDDGVIRQLFENVVIGVKQAGGTPKLESLGEAWLQATNRKYVGWTGVRPLI